MINPNQFGSMNQHDSVNGAAIHSQASEVPPTPTGVYQEATVVKSGDRFMGHGYAEDATGSMSHTSGLTYRTPLRGKIAAIHAAREATHRLGRSG